jgi:O-methyltransferase
MTPESRIHTALRDISRRLPVLRRLYGIISECQGQLEAQSKRFEAQLEDLTTTKIELTTTKAELTTTKAMLVAQNDYRTQIPMLTANLAALRSVQEDEFRSLRRLILAPEANGGSMALDLYLDLLEASLTGTLYSDVSQSPWTKDIYDPASRAVGRDWPSRAETMIGTARMSNLRILTQRVLDEHIPGDLIETGVWRGGACIYMRGILVAAGDMKRRVFVADSFCGLPPPNEALYPADAGDPHHTFHQLAISRADVEANFRRYGLLDDHVIFLEGWFKDTLPTAPIDQLALLRLDGDMYESTMDSLDALYHKVSPGGFVIVDDYVLKACAAAVEDFRGRHGISAPLNEVDGAAVWWQVPVKS